MKFTGAAVVLGDDVSTDLIFPSDAILSIAPFRPGEAEYDRCLLEHGLKNLDFDRRALGSASLLVAGHGLGVGSSRQYAVEVLKAHGIRGVLAESIHPIFFRNLWNLGMFALEVDGISSVVAPGDSLSVDLGAGIVVHHASGTTFTLPLALPAWLEELLTAGGLLPFWEQRASGAALPSAC